MIMKLEKNVTEEIMVLLLLFVATYLCIKLAFILIIL